MSRNIRGGRVLYVSGLTDTSVNDARVLFNTHTPIHPTTYPWKGHRARRQDVSVSPIIKSVHLVILSKEFPPNG